MQAMKGGATRHIGQVSMSMPDTRVEHRARPPGSSPPGGVGSAPVAHAPRGLVRYPLKTPYRDGTTHVLFEPLDFIPRLAALAPKPRVNLTRYHGVFAPHSAHRAQVTKAGRGRGARRPEDSTPAERRAAMSFARNA
jgi:hypothetical protein